MLSFVGWGFVVADDLVGLITALREFSDVFGVLFVVAVAFELMSFVIYIFRVGRPR